MRLKITGLALLIAALAVVAFASGYRRGRNHGQVADRGVPYTMQSRVTHFSPDGNIQAVSDEIRYESSNGTYRKVSVTGGITRVISHQAGRGFFVVDDTHRLLLKDPVSGPNRDNLAGASPEELRAMPQFVRTDELLGHTAYVLQFRDPDSCVMFEESWVIPELGHTPVKFIDYDRLTGKLLMTSEPASIVPGEPAPELLRLLDYPEKVVKAQMR